MFHPQMGVFAIHCVCHRLALIVTDAFKGTKNYEPVIPEMCLQCLTSIYDYFCKSTRRKKKLREFIANKNATIREDQRQANRDRRRLPLLEREHRNPYDALESTLNVLEEQHKLPRRVVMTRWLSSADAIKVLVTSRGTYQDFFQFENSDKGMEIYEWLHDNTVFGWYYCLLDVIPVLMGMNILFQSNLPLPHLLYPKIQSAKSTLMNMVNTGETGRTRTELLPLELVDENTKFGAYANKYMEDESYTFTVNELKDIKKGWHHLYAHCLTEIDRRFPPENMKVFQFMQLLDPNIVHGTMPRQRIGTHDLSTVASTLLAIFEVPLHVSLASTQYSFLDIKNAFTAYKSSKVCAELWELHVARPSFDNASVYSYYKILLEMPDIAPWAFACLLLIIFPTGNAVAERGFAQMGGVHNKERSEMTAAQVWAHMLVLYNGPTTVAAYADKLNVDSRVPGWWGHVNQSNYNN
jgi:hypothetical protein